MKKIKKFNESYNINDNSGLGNEIIDLYQKLSDFNKKLEKI